MTTSEKPGRAERLARLRELPPAVCRVCGAHVSTGTGTRLPAQLGDDERMQAEWRAVLARQQFGTLQLPLARYRAQVDDWRRAHAGCVAEPLPILQRVLGNRCPEDLTPKQAADAVADAGVALIAARVAYRGGRMFGWIGRAERCALLESIQYVRGADAPKRCADGRCGMCGRSHSLSWVESPLRWPDGSSAAMCGECWDAVDRRPDAAENIERLRVIGAEVLSGTSAFGMTPLGLLLACELPGVDRTAEAEPWQYSDRLAKLREDIRIQWPSGLTDAAERERYQLLRLEREREWQRERAEDERAERDREQATVLTGWEDAR